MNGLYYYKCVTLGKLYKVVNGNYVKYRNGRIKFYHQFGMR